MAMSYSYEKLGFTSGQTLKAEHLNHMEDGIANPCWNDMKNKPFGEETVTVNEPLNITWDGNTEGLASFDFDSPMYKVSDVVFSQEQVKILELCLSNGITQDVAEGAFYFDCCSVWAFTTTRYQVFAVFSEKDNATFAHPGSGETIIVPEAGVYFSYSNSDAPYIELLTSSESIEQTKTVVKKIDEKYLPEVGGGGGMFVTVRKNDAGEYVADRTYEEVYASIVSGQNTVVCLDYRGELYILYPYLISNGLNFTLVISGGFDASHTVTFNTDGTITVTVVK